VAHESRFEPLLPWERRGLWVLLAFFVVFGVLVEYRSAFLKRRMTDLNCYLRADRPELLPARLLGRPPRRPADVPRLRR
jgi:hypothetical protein